MLVDPATLFSISRVRNSFLSLVLFSLSVHADAVIHHFDPPAAMAGATVLLEGEGLAGAKKVLLGDVSLTIVKRSESALRVRVATDAKDNPFVVGTEQGRAESGEVFRVMRYAKLLGFTPTYGPVGSEVRLQGERFTEQDNVFLGTMALPVGAFRESELTVTIPKGARPDYLGVESHGRLIKSREIFRVVAPPPPLALVVTPTSGPPGSEVRMSLGRPFRDPPQDQLYFAGQLLKPMILSGRMQLAVRIPEGAKTGFFELVLSENERIRSTRPFEVTSTEEAK